MYFSILIKYLNYKQYPSKFNDIYIISLVKIELN